MDTHSLVKVLLPSFFHQFTTKDDYAQAAKKAFDAAEAVMAEAQRRKCQMLLAGDGVSLEELYAHADDPTIELNAFENSLRRQYVGFDRERNSFTVPRSVIIRELDKHIITQEETNGNKARTPKPNGQGTT